MRERYKIAVVATVAVVVLLAAVLTASDSIRDRLFGPTGSSIKQGIETADTTEATEIIARDLTVPWGLAFLPGDDTLVTERSGTLRRIGQNQQTHEISGVAHVGEGGLLGITPHPQFEQNRWLYLYMTTRSESGLTNRVERYRYTGNSLTDREVIIENIPGASNHDGGRIAFGPDGYLYVTTGDAGNEQLAQDTDSLAGKILRLTSSGSIPPDNPFRNAVYSYGHRNPQGLAWDSQGRLWSSEHGRSGVRSGFDELNLIRKGANYGWPVIEGDETRSGMVSPVAHSGSDETWAPASLAFNEGSLFFGGLRGQTLYEAKINNENSVSLTAHLRQEYGRLRTVSVGPRDSLYITTSNTDGRGRPNSGDDKVIRLSLEVFRR